MDTSKRPGSVALLVGLVLLVTAAGMAGAFMPIAECPLCKGRRRWVLPTETNCVFCAGKGKLTLIKLWNVRVKAAAIP